MPHRWRRASLVLLSFTTVPGVARSQGAQAQAAADTRWDHGWIAETVANPVLDLRIKAAMPRYRQYGTIARAAFYNITYPKDCKELAAMRGYALAVVTAFAQDSTELPAPRAYVRTPSGDRQLTPYAAVESRVPSVDTLVRSMLGPFRGDMVYLFPVDLARVTGDFLLDFAARAREYRLVHLQGETPRVVLACPPVLRASPSTDSLTAWAMFKREYPELARTLAAAR